MVVSVSSSRRGRDGAIVRGEDARVNSTDGAVTLGRTASGAYHQSDSGCGSTAFRLRFARPRVTGGRDMTIEYVAPGVFVEEVEGGSHVIAGVPTSAAPFIGVYAHAMPLATRSPDWTEHGRGDPAITLLELLAWLAESLLHRRGALPEAAVHAAARLATASLALVSGRVLPDTDALNAIAFVSTQPFDDKRLALALDDLCRFARGRASYGTKEGLEVETPGDVGLAIAVGPGLSIGAEGSDFLPGSDDAGSGERASVKRSKDP